METSRTLYINSTVSHRHEYLTMDCFSFHYFRASWETVKMLSQACCPWLTVSPRPKAELSVLSSNKWIFKIINKRSLKWKSPCFNSSFNIKITFYVFTNTCSKSSTVCIPDENIVTLWLRSSLNKSWWANDCDRSKNILNNDIVWLLNLYFTASKIIILTLFFSSSSLSITLKYSSILFLFSSNHLSLVSTSLINLSQFDFVWRENN